MSFLLKMDSPSSILILKILVEWVNFLRHPLLFN
jgi:hypothetical protein